MGGEWRWDCINKVCTKLDCFHLIHLIKQPKLGGLLTRQLTSNIEHPTHNNPTPNSQLPTPNTQLPTQHPTPNTQHQHPTPYTQHPAPNTQHTTHNTALCNISQVSVIDRKGNQLRMIYSWFFQEVLTMICPTVFDGRIQFAICLLLRPRARQRNTSIFLA